MTPTMMKTKVGLGKLVLFSGVEWAISCMFGCRSWFKRWFGEEVPHGGGYLLEVGFEGEVACVQKLNGGIGVIARVGFCARGMKNGSFLPQIARSGGFDLRKYS